MIKSVADLVLNLKEKEEEIINAFSQKYTDTQHPTIIGDMYEGVAKKILEKSIFEGFDLRIASGQISNSKGELSNEVDCMIVEGDGNLIPNTDKYVYDISNVVAVIEVKKNLYKQDLEDSHYKMAKLGRMFDVRDMNSNEHQLFRDAFRATVKMDLPKHEDVSNYSLEIQMIYHTLLIETLMPLRIIFGFYGYTGMNNLRKGFIKILEENLSTDKLKKRGFSPSFFPNLTFTRNSSLIKANGIPYSGELEDDDYWAFYVSSNHNPLNHLLEMIWTKLSYKHEISSNIFGDDLEIEGLFRFLDAKPLEKDTRIGWEYRYTELPNDLDITPVFTEWQPHELLKQEYVLIEWLASGNRMNTKSKDFLNILRECKTDEDSFLKKMRTMNLIYKDKEDNLNLLTDDCVTIIKDEKFYAGENKDGKMIAWIFK